MVVQTDQWPLEACFPKEILDWFILPLVCTFESPGELFKIPTFKDSRQESIMAVDPSISTFQLSTWLQCAVKFENL